MKKYTIDIVETSVYHVTVEAQDENEAEDRAEDMIEDGSYLSMNGERVEILTQDIQELK